MSIVASSIATLLPTALVAGLTATAAWLMKKILMGLLIGIGRILTGMLHAVWNAIKWKIGWY